MDKSQLDVTGLILCGGKGSRLGNKDKGLAIFKGKTLIEHMIERVKPQVGHLLININQNEELYAAYGEQLTTDPDDNFMGPLAGILSAASVITTEFCFVIPCDMPHVPLNTVARLFSVMDKNIAVAVSNQGRVQPLVLLVRTTAISSIINRLGGHNKSVLGWLESINYVTEDFHDSPTAFQNLNEPSQFK
ncbi:MAG: molybdopterin-guanine dinucleotide biosynthesis protein A [Candidatus Azotimanducaceae bacterium]|jgi:molybdopterin-guanine dinucleotide biosynthesis protein A